MRKRRGARAPADARCTRPLRLMRELRGRKNCAIDILRPYSTNVPHTLSVLPRALIRPRLRRNRLDIIRQRLQVPRPRTETHTTSHIDPHERVLEPAPIVAFRVVLARVCPAALRAVGSRLNGGARLQQQILKLKRLDEVAVPHQRTV